MGGGWLRVLLSSPLLELCQLEPSCSTSSLTTSAHLMLGSWSHWESARTSQNLLSVRCMEQVRDLVGQSHMQSLQEEATTPERQAGVDR